ncbi:MAG: hypothetical protein IPM04_13980 [Saprospiraceae bacterium]|nr:hypothetical protein [Candidatus Brachybacter algidus]
MIDSPLCVNPDDTNFRITCFSVNIHGTKSVIDYCITAGINIIIGKAIVSFISGITISKAIPASL